MGAVTDASLAVLGLARSASGDDPDVEAVNVLLADQDPALLVVVAARLLHAAAADLGRHLGKDARAVLDDITAAIIAAPEK